MSYDGQIKPRTFSPIEKGPETATRIPDDTEVAIANAPSIRNIGHHHDDGEHDPSCEVCKDYITPYPNRWSRYRSVAAALISRIFFDGSTPLLT